MPDGLPPDQTLVEPPPGRDTATAAASSESGASVRRPGLVLALLATATFLASLDLLIVNVALDPIGRGIGTRDLSDLSWILSGYAIVIAALLVPAGRLADRYGRKGAFIVGLGLFAAASLGAALSGQLWLLVVFRVIQAAGAAILTPASLGLVLATAPPAKLHKYVQIWAASGSLAAAAGPAAGGLLANAAWQWIFLINIPLCLAAIAMAIPLIPNVRHDLASRIPDLLGGLLIILAVGALAVGLVKAPDWGWGAASTLVSLILAAVSLIAFVVRSSRAHVPIVELGIFRNVVFSSANVAVVLFYASFTLQLLGIIQWLEQQGDWSVVKTGFAVAPGPGMVFVASLLAARLAHRLPVGLIAAVGALLSGAGIALITLSTGGHAIHYASGILPGWLIGGFGMGLALPTMFSSATRDLPPHQAATGSAVVNMGSQIGSVLGVSLLVIFLALPDSDPHHGYAISWWTSTALALASAIAALGLNARRHAHTAGA
ncbi:MFS transporter [Streptomyces brasiliensis]|uniref:MFS transporter n=1 Tax=Streptomyces brasiliensis TaxID=1954 RepID=A0A917LB29_9ACTN|nr:MFS transporter [Streptomyces brasiliensis]GGJ53254.1 MFS transporter [Streptomyces brasiliensis]